MLGIDYTSSQQYFIQSRIIAENPFKINPFLKFFLAGVFFFPSPGALPFW